MPHKHKRKADGDHADLFNLAPTERAAPLPVGKARAPNPRPKKQRKLTTTDYGADDTPKAFARLMAFSQRGKGPKGLDEGLPRTKKTKSKSQGQAGKEAQKESRAADAPSSEAQKVEVPKILPGEKLSDFAQRVNQALPLTGVQRNRKKVDGVSDHRVTRHEKKLKKLQAGWRKEEARIRDKEMEELELAEEEQDEIDAMWEDKTADLPETGAGKKGKKGKGKKRLVVGEVDVDEEDPWEALKKKREQRKGLHDVVQAPPEFDRVPREIFKVKNGARVNVGNVPQSAGSLRRREELGEERLTIIDTYRKLMAAKKGE
ncbi:hypothetical protein M011DRAFT_482004 [Sporormia fimetaria CBS 119925]|uniref:Uncharacterized protein n=1 Tax=Sporormia fimetaria CBS 119925 TaxID=1340428 RepID=A0A6A6UYG0_9PLEO|nr:hypothetical protein M011DRAFT_482004 [Sporormia fimetaria CBS 119925]